MTLGQTRPTVCVTELQCDKEVCPCLEMENYAEPLPAVSVLGDSQAVRLCREWWKAEPLREVDSSGARGGWTTNDLKSAVRQRVSSFKDICVILVSINDILRRHPPDKTKSNFKSILKILKTSNKSIFISTLPPPSMHHPL